jgi:hypothetical protein
LSWRQIKKEDNCWNEVSTICCPHLCDFSALKMMSIRVAFIVEFLLHSLSSWIQ